MVDEKRQPPGGLVGGAGEKGHEVVASVRSRARTVSGYWASRARSCFINVPLDPSDAGSPRSGRCACLDGREGMAATLWLAVAFLGVMPRSWVMGTTQGGLQQ